MNHLPIIAPTETEHFFDSSALLFADISSVDVPHQINTHWHPQGQLIYASSGRLNVTTSGSVVMVPSQFAVWIPPGIKHSVTANMPIDYCSLFVDPVASKNLPQHSQLLHITTLFKELTRTAACKEYGNVDGAVSRLNSVIFDQLQQLRPARVALPLPSMQRLQKLVSHYMNNPADKVDLTYWSRQLSMGSRTLTRTFRQETGMSISLWLQHLKVLKAIELLELGETVKYAAYEVGYQQPSAFIAMFKRVTGQTPVEYLSGQ